MHTHKKTLPRGLCLLIALITLILACGCDELPAMLTQTNTGARAGVRINEVVTSNSHSLTDAALGSPDWIELYNEGDKAVNLVGCGLSDNLKSPRKFVFPELTLQPGEYVIVYAMKYEGEPAALITGFGLSKSGENLYLTDRYVNILDDITIPPLAQDIAYARHEEGWFGYCASTSPGAQNPSETIARDMADVSYVTGGGQAALSEVLAKNRSGLQCADGGRYPWAEICNPTDEPVRLNEYWLSDDETNFRKWQLPDIALAPGAYTVVFFSDSKDAPSGEIHAEFNLGNEDNALYLSDNQGNVVDGLTWELPAVGDIAIVGDKLYSAFPTPGADNDTRTFDTLTPTPMDDSDPLIISEVLADNRYSLMDADGDRPEWVELQNRSGQAVSLSGYCLTDDAENLVKWALPDMTLQAGEYLVVFLSGKDRRSGELHASFGLSDTDEAIQLVNLDGMRADSIPLAQGLPENVSISRKGDGTLLYHAYPTPNSRNDSAGHESFIGLSMPDGTSVYINEVSASSPIKSTKTDWIELYNPLDSDVSLAGWSLSDSADDPHKHVIESLTIRAKGYALLNAATRTPQAASVTAFNISAGGERLFLTDDAGILRDRFETGVLRHDGSSGRNDAGERVFYASPTPGAKNEGSAYHSYTAAPAFSELKLYHTQPFTLTLSSSTQGADIYYTLDGSMPDAQSARCTAPIAISGNTVVRAVALSSGLLSSETVTHTYLFEQTHTLPVLSICGSQADIDAVYAAIDKKERVEREAYLEYFEPEGGLGVASPIGMRASGASTLTYPQKSFTLFFRGGYERKSVSYPFFEDYHINTFTALVIRNSGQDTSKARLRDSYYSLASEGLYIDNFASRPVVVYLNGRYWGLYDLNENQNEEYLEAHYGADKDAVDIIRRNTTALSGKNTDIKRIQAYGRERDFSDPAVYEEYCKWVDMDYLIDYIITRTFFADGDIFNQKYWRSQDYSVKWRPMLFDMDLGLSSASPTRNILGEYFKYEGVPSQDGSITTMDMYCGLKASPIWRERFVKRYVFVVVNHYNANRLTALLDAHAAAMRPEMARQIKRWGRPSSVSGWESAVKALRDCLEKRPEHVLRAVKSYFNVSDADMESYMQAAQTESIRLVV